MKSIKKMLNDELELMVPHDPSDRIISEPLPRIQPNQYTARERTQKKAFSKKFMPALVSCMCCLIMACVAVPMALRSDTGSVVLMEINPSI